MPNVPRRSFLAALVGLGGTTLALGNTGDNAKTIYGGTMALSQAYNVAGDLWIGPDSAKSNVDANDGRVYMASDTQVDYYGDNGSWTKLGLGSSTEGIPSLTLSDTSTSPSTNGEWRLNGSDVEVQSGGSTQNLSNIGSGSYTDENAQDAVGNNYDSTLSYDDATPSFGIADSGVGSTQIATDAVGGSEINLSDIAGQNLTVDTTNDELDASGSGSAVEVQDSGTSLTTDVSLIDVLSPLTASEPVTNEIDLDINLGNGVEDNSGTLRVDGGAVAGNVLSEGTNPYEVDLNIGNGVEDNSGTLRVNPAGIAGDGLKETSATSMGVEPADFAGAGLKDDGSDNLESQDVRVVSSSLNAQDIDTILMDASGGARSVQLPTPSSDINVTVKKTDSSGNAVDITTPGAETIDGQTSLSITSQYTSRTIVSDGSNYFIV